MTKYSYLGSNKEQSLLYVSLFCSEVKMPAGEPLCSPTKYHKAHHLLKLFFFSYEGVVSILFQSPDRISPLLVVHTFVFVIC